MVVNDPVVDLLQRARLSIPLQRVLGRAAEEFERNGTWVTFDQLAYDAADQNLPSPMNELHHLPRALGGAWPGESVSLTGLGLLAAGTAPQTAQLMARLAQICAERNGGCATTHTSGASSWKRNTALPPRKRRAHATFSV
jgi:hypothetical protein